MRADIRASAPTKRAWLRSTPPHHTAAPPAHRTPHRGHTRAPHTAAAPANPRNIPANPPYNGVHSAHLATMSLPVGMPEEPSGTT
ncbi:hypothetical protein GCM10009651_34450 [Microbacterium natoriense]